MSITLTPKLKQEYEDLFASCVTNAAKLATVDAIIKKIIGNRGRYEAV